MLIHYNDRESYTGDDYSAAGVMFIREATAAWKKIPASCLPRASADGSAGFCNAFA
jgi:hypothetical protein